MRNQFQILSTLLLLVVNYLAFAQSKQGKVWVNGSGVSFKVIFEPTGIINKYLDTAYSPYFHLGNSNICDTNGNLILSSDGYNVYDSSVNFIDGGDTLVPNDFYIDQDGWSGISQSSIFLPMDSNQYYFITPAMSDIRFADCNLNNHCYFDQLLYNVIDMNANGGAGKVVKRMIPLMENADLRKTQMMACRHSNGKDWWLLKQGGDSNTVYKFLFRQDTVENHGFQKFDYPVWGGWDIRGQSTFSVDGSKYATTSHGGSTGKIFMADFDRCYGILSNPQELIMPVGSQQNPDTNWTEQLSVGLAYSPNGEILYVIGMSNIYQYDLQNGSWYHVAGIDTTYLHFTKYENCYLGLDNKLYIGNFHGTSKQMSVIDNPDVKGAGCNFCPRCLRLDSVYYYGGVATPPCMPNYSLGAQECWALGNDEFLMLNDELEVWPNPASFMLNVKCSMLNEKGNKYKIEMYNAVGQMLLSTSEKQIDVRKYASGVYYIKLGTAVKKIIIE